MVICCYCQHVQVSKRCVDAQISTKPSPSVVTAGVTGIALAQAGASVTLTDLPHICMLTRENVEANCNTSSTCVQV